MDIEASDLIVKTRASTSKFILRFTQLGMQLYHLGIGFQFWVSLS